ncbi:monocarboxylate transporter 12-like [Galendromus occidentalis]|uniref:Monocarboxylate transporter 12-like n=1 Tax=Galendromus occidentalis TaxID=34638 RepID=A0AAJ6VXA6_9ACAR|nr:monocarboxylate transporter 12-like [Galendromus occidentalis]
MPRRKETVRNGSTLRHDQRCGESRSRVLAEIRLSELHGMIIVACVFWINFCLFGLLRSGALIYVELVTTFNCSYDVASWPLSLAGASICMIGPVVGLMEKIISIRAIVTWGIFIASASCALCYWVYDVGYFVILIGLLYGLGTGLTCTLTPVLLNERFPPEQRTLANGIAFSGSSVGSFVWPFLLEWLVKEFNLRGAMLIYGGLILNALLGALFLRRPNEVARDGVKRGKREERIGNSDEIGSLFDQTVKPSIKFAEKKEEKSSPLVRCIKTLQKDLSVFLDPYFQLITISQVCFLFVYVTVFIVITDYAMDSGIQRSDTMFLMTIFGISDLISKPLPGMLTYNNFLTTKALLIIGSVAMGVICFILPYTRTYLWFAIIAFIYGLLTGGLSFIGPIIFQENISENQVPFAIGLGNFFVGITGFLRPPFIGVFKDTFGNYDGLFFSMGVICIASASLWSLEPLIIRSRRKSKKAEAMKAVNAGASIEQDPLVSA